MPIQPTQVYQKGDQISTISSSLWALSLSIPLGNSALLFRVSSYHNADSVPLLICNMFYFSCKKKKEMFCFLPCESSCAIACFRIFTVLYCYSFLQNGANCWLSSCFLTASHTNHLLLHLQHSQCQNLAPMNSTNSCLLEADRKCLINILWPGFGCISQIVSCKHVKHTSLWCFIIVDILMKVSHTHPHVNVQPIDCDVLVIFACSKGSFSNDK